MSLKALKIKSEDLVSNKKSENQIAVRMPQQLRKALDLYAAGNGLTSSYVIRKAVLTYLEDKGQLIVEREK